MKKSKILLWGIIVIVVGIGLMIYSRLTTYVDEQNVLRENFSTPLSAIFILLGMVLLLISVVLFFVNKKK